jgi:hypothetical protein
MVEILMDSSARNFENLKIFSLSSKDFLTPIERYKASQESSLFLKTSSSGQDPLQFRA